MENVKGNVGVYGFRGIQDEVGSLYKDEILYCVS
jgi:hypothetical protein